jgi:hypothetical protein
MKASLLKILRGPKCGVNIITRTTKRLIAEKMPNSNSRTRLALKPNLDLNKSLWPFISFLKKSMHSKGSWSLERLKAARRGRLNCLPWLKLI